MGELYFSGSDVRVYVVGYWLEEVTYVQINERTDIGPVYTTDSFLPVGALAGRNAVYGTMAFNLKFTTYIEKMADVIPGVEIMSNGSVYVPYILIEFVNPLADHKPSIELRHVFFSGSSLTTTVDGAPTQYVYQFIALGMNRFDKKTTPQLLEVEESEETPAIPVPRFNIQVVPEEIYTLGPIVVVVTDQGNFALADVVTKSGVSIDMPSAKLTLVEVTGYLTHDLPCAYFKKGQELWNLRLVQDGKVNYAPFVVRNAFQQYMGIALNKKDVVANLHVTGTLANAYDYPVSGVVSIPEGIESVDTVDPNDIYGVTDVNDIGLNAVLTQLQSKDPNIEIAAMPIESKNVYYAKTPYYAIDIAVVLLFNRYANATKDSPYAVKGLILRE